MSTSVGVMAGLLWAAAAIDESMLLRSVSYNAPGIMSAIGDILLPHGASRFARRSRHLIRRAQISQCKGYSGCNRSQWPTLLFLRIPKQIPFKLTQPSKKARGDSKYQQRITKGELLSAFLVRLSSTRLNTPLWTRQGYSRKMCSFLRR